MNPPLPNATTLWSDPAVLAQYDVVLLPCFAGGSFGYTAESHQTIKEYADQGGRLYVTHHGGEWMRDDPQPYPGLVAWNGQPDPPSPLQSFVDTSFPKGQIFADWLQLVG